MALDPQNRPSPLVFQKRAGPESISSPRKRGKHLRKREGMLSLRRGKVELAASLPLHGHAQPSRHFDGKGMLPP
jgi:hypothetical protein